MKQRRGHRGNRKHNVRVNRIGRYHEPTAGLPCQTSGQKQHPLSRGDSRRQSSRHRYEEHDGRFEVVCMASLRTTKIDRHYIVSEKRNVVMAADVRALPRMCMELNVLVRRQGKRREHSRIGSDFTSTAVFPGASCIFHT